ncbi:hypothetical protein [Verrucomicrobium spinosum]|uniref:hypothetical protein n=1 Tax=Verrucomicrobium spinosum TaxID=2736 RepID=UPI000A4A6C54|nr:hypothetical protein [Verrucomicrobium spinosum]
MYKAGAVTKMPNIMLAATRTLFGDVQFTCLHAEASAWADANSLFTDSTEAYPGDAAFNAAQIITQPYTCSWGEDAPWDSFQTQEGIAVEFNLQLNPETNDHKGLFDYTFQSLDVSAKFIPDGVTPAQVLALLKHQALGPCVAGVPRPPTSSRSQARVCSSPSVEQLRSWATRPMVRVCAGWADGVPGHPHLHWRSGGSALCGGDGRP